VIGGLTGDSSSQSALNSYDYGPTTGDYPSEYAPYGSYTSPIIDVGGIYSVTNISWNTTITTSNNMSLTLQYYCGNSQINLTLCSAPTAGAADGIRQTSNITVGQQARYWQYKVNYLRGSVVKQTPILNWVRLDYYFPPDLMVVGMDAPIVSSVTRSLTLTVYVSNTFGSGPLLRQARAPTRAQLASRPSPRMANASPDFGFFWVDLYITTTQPASVPTVLGDCYGAYNQSSIMPGQKVPVQINYYKDDTSGCQVPPGKNTFYAQVDTCPDTSQCSAIYGYIIELSESNNVGGPYLSNLFQLSLPIIRR